MHKFTPLLLAFLLLTLIGPLHGQRPADTLSIAASIARYSMNNPQFSPDGTKAVVVVSFSGSADRPRSSHIWLLDVLTDSIRQFTNSVKSETDPRWSPDGTQLAFISDRDGENQVYLMNMNGGEALAQTASKSGVDGFAWNPKGGSIVYWEQRPPSEAEKKRNEDKYDERVVSESQRPSQLYLLELGTKKAVSLPLAGVGINELKWMPSGEDLLMQTVGLPVAEIPTLALIRYSIRDSAIHTLTAPDNPCWEQIQISADGKRFSFQGARQDGPIAHDLYTGSLLEGQATNLTAKRLDLPVLYSLFEDDHHWLSLVQKGFHQRLYRLSDKGDVVPYPIQANMTSFDVSLDGTLLFVSGSATRLPEIWLAAKKQQPRQVSHFNRALDSMALAAPKLFTYKSFDGTPVEAALYKPSGSEGKLLPLVVLIHGGPTGVFSDNYAPWIQLLVQKGYAVFCPNIRGSMGYGFDFLASNRHDWGGGDFRDIMAGVDTLIAREHIDSARMGICGWSYGGYMTAWAITQTRRFKAAMSGAGLSNLASEFGTEGSAYYDRWFFGTPYEHQDNFLKHSPVTFIKQAVTPTLIIQGENDETDPVGQSQELYRGLRYYHVPTELVLYPREPHGFREPGHIIDFYSRMMDWFQKYIR